MKQNENKQKNQNTNLRKESNLIGQQGKQHQLQLKQRQRITHPNEDHHRRPKYQLFPINHSSVLYTQYNEQVKKGANNTDYTHHIASIPNNQVIYTKERSKQQRQ